MSGRKIAAFAIVFVAAIIVAGYFAVKKARPTAEDRNPLAGVEIDAVSRIVLASPDTTATIERDDTGWRLSAPVSDAADPENVEGLWSALSDFSIGAVVSERKDRWDAYGVSEASATRIQVFFEGKAEPAFDGLFGKQAFSYGSVYFRFADEERIHLADDVALWRLRQTSEAYRDARIFGDVEFESVTRIEADLGDVDVLIERSSDTWATSTGATLEPSAASGIVNQLSTMRSAGFATVNASAPVTGLAVSSLTVTVSGDGFTRTLAVGADVKQAVAEPSRYAAVDGRDVVFFLRESQLARLRDRFNAATVPLP